MICIRNEYQSARQTLFFKNRASGLKLELDCATIRYNDAETDQERREAQRMIDIANLKLNELRGQVMRAACEKALMEVGL